MSHSWLIKYWLPSVFKYSSLSCKMWLFLNGLYCLDLDFADLFQGSVDFYVTFSWTKMSVFIDPHAWTKRYNFILSFSCMPQLHECILCQYQFLAFSIANNAMFCKVVIFYHIDNVSDVSDLFIHAWKSLRMLSTEHNIVKLLWVKYKTVL